MSEITPILKAIDLGDPNAAGELLPLMYRELRCLAAHMMARRAPGQTLQPTELVHEACLRLLRRENGHFEGRAHFFHAAAEAMRQILVDRARRKAAVRHGGGQERLNVDEVEIAAPGKDPELLAVHEVLDKFAAEHPQRAELTKLRYFAGLTFEETAEVMGISVATAKRHWAWARVWLYSEIQASLPR